MMQKCTGLLFALISSLVLFGAASVVPVIAADPLVKPENIGLSSERLRRVPEMIQRHIEAKDFAGAVTLVARYGRIAHLEGQGLMDIESGTPMPSDAIVRVGSMTKPVVATAIMMLVEESKVRLADPVSRFIPEFKGLTVAIARPAASPPGANAGPAPRFYSVPSDREITVRDLLTHTSGLVSGPISHGEAEKVRVRGQDTLADYVPRLAAVPLEFQPGVRWAYGDAAFNVLLRIVELASGTSADRFLEQRIFAPLGMKDTFFYPVEGRPRLAPLYGRTASGFVKQPNPSDLWNENGKYVSGAGNLMSTAEDYFRFAQMLLNGGELNGIRLLAPRVVEIMRSAVVPETLPGRVVGEGYGLGMRVITNPLTRNTMLSTGSFGWSGGFGTHFWVDPKEHVVGILMAQTDTTTVRPALETAVMQAIVEPAGR
jgi:CubicO group peptidase (beta-lactamase class C family)